MTNNIIINTEKIISCKNCDYDMYIYPQHVCIREARCSIYECFLYKNNKTNSINCGELFEIGVMI